MSFLHDSTKLAFTIHSGESRFSSPKEYTRLVYQQFRLEMIFHFKVNREVGKYGFGPFVVAFFVGGEDFEEECNVFRATYIKI